MSFYLFLLCFAICFSALFSGLETGIYSVSRVKVYFREKEKKEFQCLSKVLAKPQEMVTTLLLGNNIAHYICSFSTTHILICLAFPQPEIWATFFLTPLLFIFAEVVPKELFRRHADGWMAFFAPYLRAIYFLFCPLVYALLFIGKGISFLLGQTHEKIQITRQKVRLYLLERSGLSSHLTSWVENLFRLGETKLLHVMKPARQVICLEETMDRETVLAILRRHGFSRYPVLGKKKGQPEILGVVHIFSILFHPENQPFSLLELSRPPLYLDPQLSLNDGLRRLQNSTSPFGIVGSPGGKFLGIVTTKDFFEEFMRGI